MKQETLEEVAENYGWRIKTNTFSDPVKANELANSAKQDFINGAKWQQERSYSEEEVINLLETQRGNSYVAVLSATKNDELASIALNAPKPGGMKQFKKK
jgi:hypothetical protein